MNKINGAEYPTLLRAFSYIYLIFNKPLYVAALMCFFIPMLLGRAKVIRMFLSAGIL